jgi:hypothetical protein
MSCQLTAGGPASIYPLKDSQIADLRGLADRYATGLMAKGATLESRFGTVMKPDGVPFYLVTYSPASAQAAPWQGLFFAEQGPFYLTGDVSVDPVAGTMSVDASVLSGAATVVHVRWVVTGSPAARTPTNIAGMLTSLDIANPGPHARDCLERCLALHAPQCVPIRAGNEPELVATIAACAASCLVNCVC